MQAHLKAVGITGACKELTLKEAILKDNISVSERTSFTSTNVANTTGTIFKTNKTEDSSDVYYYSGNTTNNWVKFGKDTRGTCSYNNNKVIYVDVYLSGWTEKETNLLESECTSTKICTIDGVYFTGLKDDDCEGSDGTIINEKATFNPQQYDAHWRIIRTNEDGSVRLLYFGTSPDTTESYIGASYFNDNNYVGQSGYMYDLYFSDSTSYDEIRTNANDSLVKTLIDSWYKKNLLSNYDKYISKSAIYCNDRSIKDKDNFSMPTRDDVGAHIRLSHESPSYKCGADKDNNLIESTQAVADKFSASTTGGGNGQLKYPIALMTADEITFASISSTKWYNTSSNEVSVNLGWWLLSPSSYRLNSQVYYISSTGGMGYTKPNELYTVRPVISLDKCVKVTGSGTTTDPYIVNESASTC